MAQNPPEGTPRLAPLIFYEDVGAALEFIGKAFGFKERMRMPGPDGSIMHAEMDLADCRIMMGGVDASRGCLSAKGLPGVTSTLYVFVDDVDAHCKQARAAGATIVSEPEDQFWGDRMYLANDCEGHHWNFSTHVRDVSPEDMKPPGA